MSSYVLKPHTSPFHPSLPSFLSSLQAPLLPSFPCFFTIALILSITFIFYILGQTSNAMNEISIFKPRIEERCKCGQRERGVCFRASQMSFWLCRGWAAEIGLCRCPRVWGQGIFALFYPLMKFVLSRVQKQSFPGPLKTRITCWGHWVAAERVHVWRECVSGDGVIHTSSSGCG